MRFERAEPKGVPETVRGTVSAANGWSPGPEPVRVAAIGPGDRLRFERAEPRDQPNQNMRKAALSPTAGGRRNALEHPFIPQHHSPPSWSATVLKSPPKGAVGLCAAAYRP